jgi:hypothetical protein
MNGKNIDLSGFTGTTRYYKYNFGIVLTDGVKYLCEEAGCYWLIDIIGSVNMHPQEAIVGYTKQHWEEYLRCFQVWELSVNLEESSAVATMNEGNDGIDPWYTQKIEYTDFPMSHFKLYACYEDGRTIVLLPSEY